MSRSPGVPSPEALEARIAELRAAVRRAMARGDRAEARTLRAELRRAEDDWDDAVLGETGGTAAGSGRAVAPEAAAGEGTTATPGKTAAKAAAGSAAERGLVPVREQVHQALTLLGVPAAPKLIGSVYAAFFPGEIAGTRLTSLRRDEERSFRTAPYARPFYLCAALTADLLAPARGLITVSTWPLEQRVVGPLSARTHFLHAALRIAEHAARRGGTPSPDVQRLLWRFAANIPGAQGPGANGPGDAAGAVDPGVLAESAAAELAVHIEADLTHRREAAERARTRLDDAECLFGSRLRAMRAASSGGTGGTVRRGETHARADTAGTGRTAGTGGTARPTALPNVTPAPTSTTDTPSSASRSTSPRTRPGLVPLSGGQSVTAPGQAGDGAAAAVRPRRQRRPRRGRAGEDDR